jgi:hypothetical protein
MKLDFHYLKVFVYSFEDDRFKKETEICHKILIDRLLSTGCL